MQNNEQRQRTILQNKSLHKLFQLWADALNDSDKDMFVVLKDSVDIPWSIETVREYLWLPLLKDDDVIIADDKIRNKLGRYIEVENIATLEEIISAKHKKGMEIYFGLIAEALNNAGYDMRGLLKNGEQLWWDKDLVKEFLWRPVQLIQLQKKSTTQLTTKEIDEVYDTVNRHLSKHINTVVFPSYRDILIEQDYGKL